MVRHAYAPDFCSAKRVRAQTGQHPFVIAQFFFAESIEPSTAELEYLREMAAKANTNKKLTAGPRPGANLSKTV
jgi:hypothetical protein